MQHNTRYIDTKQVSMPEVRHQLQAAYEDGDNVVIKKGLGLDVSMGIIDWLTTMGAQPYIVVMSEEYPDDFIGTIQCGWRNALEATSCRAVVFDCDYFDGVPAELDEAVDAIIENHCFLNGDPVNDAVMLVKMVTM